MEIIEFLNKIFVKFFDFYYFYLNKIADHQITLIKIKKKIIKIFIKSYL